jgi:hypothetical protein
MCKHVVGASMPFAAHAADLSSVAGVEVHSDTVDKLVLPDDDAVDSGATTHQLAADGAVEPTESSPDSSSFSSISVSELKHSATKEKSHVENSTKQTKRAVQLPTPPQLPTPSPDFSQSMLLRSRLADAGAISALSTALKLTISVDKKDTSQELSRAMEFLQERAAAALASMCKSSRVCRLYINNAAAVDICSNVMLKTRRDCTLHALVLVLSCMFGAVAHTDNWW